jgi:hypothetical protein
MDFDVDNHISNIFIFYLIITSNFFVPLLPCRAQSAITDSILLRHFLGFLTMTFFVVLANTKSPLPFSRIIGLSVGLYAWFVASTRLRFDMWMLLVAILGTMYVLKIYKENADSKLEDSTKELIERVERILFFVAIGVTGLGALAYYGEKKIEYGGAFNLGKFVFGQTKCKGATPPIGFFEALRGVVKP